MIKYEIGYPINWRTQDYGTIEDYEKNLCDFEYDNLFASTFKNALKRAIRFLKKHPHTFVRITDYNTETDCIEYCDETIEVKNGIVYRSDHKLKQEWQDLFNA